MQTLALVGEEGRARNMLEGAEDGWQAGERGTLVVAPPISTYLVLDELDAALVWLERIVELQDAGGLISAPRLYAEEFESYWQNPEFKAIADRLHFITGRTKGSEPICAVE
jgi:hypothetical protein